ncbi:MAG: hypothetical protein R3F60_04430 [bacterium]
MSGVPGEATSPAPTGVARVAGLLDDAVLRVEQAFVTLAALVMTATVTLDIIFRAFATEESTLARKLLTLLSVVGVERSDANYAILRDYGTPSILALLAFLCGWAAFAAGRRRKEQPASLPLGLLWGRSPWSARGASWSSSRSCRAAGSAAVCWPSAVSAMPSTRSARRTPWGSCWRR